ncbi:MAG: polysaccharide deacetylase family protein [Terriglobales bacterium]
MPGLGEDAQLPSACGVAAAAPRPSPVEGDRLAGQNGRWGRWAGRTGRRLINALPAGVWRHAGPAGAWVAIVTFHRIASVPEDGLSFPPSRFRELCAYWRSEYEVLPLAALFQALPPPRARRLIVTFDDGYADNAEVAAPILQRFGLPATFFLATAYMDAADGHGFPWDQGYSPPPRVMSWRQAAELARAGFALGSHTCHHVRLAKCSPERVIVELQRSRQQIQTQLGQPAPDFAYPYGGPADCGDADRARVRAAGYRSCLGCHGGLAQAGGDPYRLRRIAVNPRDYLTPSAWERQFRQWLAHARREAPAAAALATA